LKSLRENISERYGKLKQSIERDYDNINSGPDDGGQAFVANSQQYDYQLSPKMNPTARATTIDT